MTVVLEVPPIPAPVFEASEVPRKLWTRDEYRRLTEDGFLEDGKVELVNGEIWDKMGQGRRHVAVVTWVFKALSEIFGFGRIQTQSSLPLSDYSEPEPDAAVLVKI